MKFRLKKARATKNAFDLSGDRRRRLDLRLNQRAAWARAGSLGALERTERHRPSARIRRRHGGQTQADTGQQSGNFARILKRRSQ
jgi:hypothetical protein